MLVCLVGIFKMTKLTEGNMRNNKGYRTAPPEPPPARLQKDCGGELSVAVVIVMLFLAVVLFSSVLGVL